MNVAIPAFGTKISPRFDCAQTIILIRCEEGQVVERLRLPFDEPRPRLRIRFLLDKQIQILLCGGIRRCDYFALLDARIKVHSGLVGEVDEILRTFLEKGLPETQPFECCQYRGGANVGKGGRMFGGSPSFSNESAWEEPSFGSGEYGGKKNGPRKR